MNIQAKPLRPSSKRLIGVTRYDKSANNNTDALNMSSADFHQVNKYRYAGWLCGLIFPLGLTAIDWPFRHLLTPSNILMIYLLGVFFTAIRFGLLASILASLTSVAAFAFFFAPPIFSFAISDQENLFEVSVMVVIGYVTSSLAQNVRTQAYVAERREQRVSALYRLSKELAEAQLDKEIIFIGVHHIYTEFGAQNTFLFPEQLGNLHYPNEPALPVSLRGADLDLAQQAFNSNRYSGYGSDYFPNAPALYMPLKGSSGILGVLVLEVSDERRILPSEQRQLLDAFISQIAHALERANLGEQAKDATLKMQAETLRNSLLSSISHDLRTPLATIVGAANTLETGEQLSESSKKKLVTAISKEAQRMTDLTTKILEMARLEAGQVVLNRQWNTPEEIVGGALHRLDKKLKHRPIKVNMAIDLPLIHVDAVLLQQVLINLLENADKYTPANSAIDITVSTNHSRLSIIVADCGPGVPTHLQDKIFDKFFRVQTESAQSGVGLGLSICKAVVEAHGGEIHVSNRSGGGAMFQLHLPQTEPPPSIEQEDKA